MLRLHLGCGCKQLSQHRPDLLRPLRLHTAPGWHASSSASGASSTSIRQHAFSTVQPQIERLQLEPQSRQETTPSSRPGPPREDYSSNLSHQAIVWSAAALFMAVEVHGLAKVDSSWAAAQCALAAFAGYFIADFASGVYHWGVDNYGDGTTPVFGSQIVGFQGHHQWPWIITQREFCNNMHKVCAPTIPFSILCLCISPWTPAWLDILAASSTALVALSQQFHGWAHTRKSELPAAVIALQDRGILVSRRMHGAHHRAPFEGNYCIVSGWWNLILDAQGSDQGFFRRLERFFHGLTGVEPRCWHEPKYDWEEQGSLEA